MERGDQKGEGSVPLDGAPFGSAQDRLRPLDCALRRAQESLGRGFARESLRMDGGGALDPPHLNPLPPGWGERRLRTLGPGSGPSIPRPRSGHLTPLDRLRTGLAPSPSQLLLGRRAVARLGDGEGGPEGGGECPPRRRPLRLRSGQASTLRLRPSTGSGEPRERLRSGEPQDGRGRSVGPPSPQSSPPGVGGEEAQNAGTGLGSFDPSALRLRSGQAGSG